MTSVVFHPLVEYTKGKVVRLEIEPCGNVDGTDTYIKFHFVNSRGNHIEGCNLFSITHYGFDPFYSIRSGFGEVSLDLVQKSTLRVIGVDEV